MRALFVTELGAGYGNAAPLVRLAEQIAAFGVEPVFALADGVQPAWLFKGRSWVRLPAPHHPTPLKPKAGPASYGDILALSGFADANDLGALATQWDGLFGLVKPTFVVASHAPTAILAARGRLPVAAIGTGFTLPPHHTPLFPALRPDTPSFRTEQTVLANANAVLADRGAPLLASLPALLDVRVRIVNSIAMMDPYARLRIDPYYQLTAMQTVAPTPIDGGVFAFLDMSGKEAANAVEALAYLCDEGPVEAHVRGPGARAALSMLRRRGAQAHAAPPPLHEALGRARAVLSQGGHSATWATALAGRPHVVIPVHFEAMLNGLAVERANAGRVAWGGSTDAILSHIAWAMQEGQSGAIAHAATMKVPSVIDPEKVLRALGVTPQRRGNSGSASAASPKRGNSRQASPGGGASAR